MDVLINTEKTLIHKVDPAYEIIACGSYRRGAEGVFVVVRVLA